MRVDLADEPAPLTAQLRDELEDLADSMVAEGVDRKRIHRGFGHEAIRDYRNRMRREEREALLMADEAASLQRELKLDAREEMLGDMLHEVEQEPRRITDDANDQAQTTLANAREQAQQVQAAARADAQRRTAELDAREASLATTRKQLDQRIREANDLEDRLEAQRAALATELSDASDAKRQLVEAAARYEAVEPTIDGVPLREAIPAIVAGIAEYFASSQSEQLAALGRTLQAWMQKRNYQGTPLMDVLVEHVAAPRKRQRPSLDDLPEAQRALDDDSLAL